MLEDLIHISTVRDCEELFDWLDDHTPQLGSGELFVRGKLIVLRTCNELLRRFSKTDATQLWCAVLKSQYSCLSRPLPPAAYDRRASHLSPRSGRVLLLLARLLPLNDRSGLNLRMAPNLDHPIKIADVQEGEKDTLVG